MRAVLLCIIGTVFLFSCKKDQHKEDEHTLDPNCTYVANGRAITHEYQVENAEELTGKKNLQPNRFYVKTFISQAEDLEKLNELGDFLPFDWRFEPNANLSHNIEASDNGVWMYGVVTNAKKGLLNSYETLDEMYYLDENEVAGRMAAHQITGKVEFYDPIDKKIKPLKDITVIVKDGGKMLQAVTDRSGNFTINNRIYAEKAEVLLKFDNPTLEIRTLDLKNLGLILTPNTISLGMMGKCAFDQLNISIGTETKNNDLYNSAAAYFSYQQFKEFAAANGYGIPEKKLNLWIARDVEFSTGYAAPMLRHVGSDQGTKDLLVKLFNIPANLAGNLANLIKKDLPDVYAPYESTDNDRTSPYHIETLYHEFGHCTQYTRSGNAFWSDYIEHIFNNGGYGSGGGTVPGLVAMSESWAEDFSFEMLSQVYGATLYPHELRDKNVWTAYRWIPVGIYYDLMDEEKNEVFDNVGGFTFPELYQIFGPDVRTPQQFRDQLFIKYPAKAEPQRDAIVALFKQYGYE